MNKPASKRLRFLLLIGFCFLFIQLNRAQQKSIHVFVALCDNENQGIVPVPSSLGKGDQPHANLYWGAAYGVKSFFNTKAPDWQLISSAKPKIDNILERLIFKHATQNVYLIADAYSGKEIKACIEDFLKAGNHQNSAIIYHNDVALNIGGSADLIAYVGHNGLMDFDVNIIYEKQNKLPKDVLVLACYSKNYFSTELSHANANPILWTTHLMAPEAYTLNAAINGWLNGESGAEIEERAAQAYNKYQKCGIRGARNLFTTGY
jgi:3-oxoacyl-ACP reductase-like protein